MKLFIALLPPAPVLDAVELLPRPRRPDVQWTGRDRWHVTLRFLGEIAPSQASRVARYLDRMDHPEVDAVIGPDLVQLSRRLVGLNVRGLDELAATVFDVTSGLGPPHEHFRGHLTVARLLTRASIDPMPGVAVRWTVPCVSLVRSHPPDEAGARYEVLHETPLRSAWADSAFRMARGEW